MHVLRMLLVGLVIGTGARLFMHKRGYATTMVLGLVGSCVAGFLGRQAGWFQGPVNLAGITVSIVGAVLALVVYRALSRRLAGAAH